jgi:hypothetical protein
VVSVSQTCYVEDHWSSRRRRTPVVAQRGILLSQPQQCTVERLTHDGTQNASSLAGIDLLTFIDQVGGVVIDLSIDEHVEINACS